MARDSKVCCAFVSYAGVLEPPGNASVAIDGSKFKAETT